MTAKATYQQLEELCSTLKAENKSLSAQVSKLSAELDVVREEYQCAQQDRAAEQQENQDAAQQLFEALRDFCQQPQERTHGGLTTPTLGVESTSDSSSWDALENKVLAMSARINKISSPQKLGSLEEAPARRSSFRRSRLSLGGRRDPVGSFGEVVAQIARDRASRQQKLGNQENAPAEPALTPPSLTPPISHKDRPSSLTSSYRRCSFGRSPCSSLNQASTATPSAADNMVHMHTNMLANMSGDKSASPCADGGGKPSSVQESIARPLDRDPLLDIAPTPGPEDSFNFAEKVLSDITPSAQPEGLASLLASVVQQAKSKAVKSIAAEAEASANCGCCTIVYK